MDAAYLKLDRIANQIAELSDNEVDRLARMMVRRGYWSTGTLLDCLQAEFKAVAKELELE